MIYDKIELTKIAKELKVVRDTYEKVLRLTDVLYYINTNEFLKNKLVLKGGTAINLLYTDLPRLSVDIDLDFTGDYTREEMLSHREEIDKIIDDIKNNRTQESFLYEVVMAVRRKEELRKAQLAGDVSYGVRRR